MKACSYAGFDFLTTANNHCLDRGLEGLAQTIHNIEKVGIVHTGTYALEEKSREITVVNIQGMKVTFVSATFGTNSEVNGIMLSYDQLWRVNLLKKQK